MWDQTTDPDPETLRQLSRNKRGGDLTAAPPGHSGLLQGLLTFGWRANWGASAHSRIPLGTAPGSGVFSGYPTAEKEWGQDTTESLAGRVEERSSGIRRRQQHPRRTWHNKRISATVTDASASPQGCPQDWDRASDNLVQEVTLFVFSSIIVSIDKCKEGAQDFSTFLGSQ